MKIDNPTSVTFEVEPETRTIRGLALPFGDVAKSGGMSWSFAKGSLTWGKVKLLNNHDWSQVLGIAELEEADEGLFMTAKVARGPRGDEILALAEMGAIDGLSVGLADDVKATARDGVHHAKSGTLREISTTPIPAFERASITSVAASAADQEGNTMPDTETTEGETTTEGVSLSADEVRKIFAEEISKSRTEDKRPVIPAGRPDAAVATFQVREESMYRFDGGVSTSGHDLSADLVAAIKGDREAYGRVLGFMSEELVSPQGLEFVDTGDTAAVNPASYRPDLFKDEEPAQPAKLYDCFHAGGLSDVTPFFYSKLGAYSGLIGAHSEGVPPTAGSFTTETGETITPAPVSGRIFITREVADQGGNPQVSGLIWAKFQRVFREMLETRTAQVVHDNLDDFANLITTTGLEDGAALGAMLKQGLVDLQFTPNGSRFSRFFSAKDLYSELAAAVDGNDRPLYPIVAASNADGTASNRLGNINVAGINLEPTWSTEIEYAGASDNASIYADPMAIKVWNSGLTRLDKVGETAAGWNVDVFAYVATHLYDATGVRKVTFEKGA